MQTRQMGLADVPPSLETHPNVHVNMPYMECLGE